MMFKKKYFIYLCLLFLIALCIRFLFFPKNVYFGFDQARDAYASLAVAHGDLRIIGPPTAIEGLNHGPLYYYIFAPIYLIGRGNPEWIAAFLRIVNSLGIFLVFVIGTIVFNKKVGLIAALFYAFSFEQIQYAIFLNHPSLAVISVLIFYLGLSLLIFRNNEKGFMIALIGLALSIQFEFVMTYLFAVSLITYLVFRKKFLKIRKKFVFEGFGFFVLILSSFILSEIKFNFRGIKTVVNVVSNIGQQKQSVNYLHNILFILKRSINDNLFSTDKFFWVFILLLIFTVGYFCIKNSSRKKIVFLSIWLSGGILPYIRNTSTLPLYYYTAGASVSLIIFFALLVEKSFSKNKIMGIVLLIIPLISNIYLIRKYNPVGSIPEVNVQSGMLLSDEKRVVDYVYNKADNEPFSVNALTMPFYVNTTWSYLFEWYGQSQYHYLPVWGGTQALGYPGNLEVEKARSKLPQKIFLIIEPTRGIESYLIDKFFTEENYFTRITEERNFGGFKVQTREKI
ncbi:hypothetical protein A2627_00715 [Candidatus Woesebacteria bacterium RIFCSPHIGHO2_01_FULL_39_28]|uniref:Glycosyltransferase RgtA/B/C/D-like domain-containing protein n=1 Tax=Candidatus Woesebacteria bacterium RIFCSPHIGHO2_01_FULL_39_28 TaxID=1802496 RepID=A0A1F7YGR5_9BACT|nr:MAG: hypothetical protein A2627_00715 [Candidatus Woesebacteria bacterium RIFCSPHIGHO2_01_FULL_39_28]